MTVGPSWLIHPSDQLHKSVSRNSHSWPADLQWCCKNLPLALSAGCISLSPLLMTMCTITPLTFMLCFGRGYSLVDYNLMNVHYIFFFFLYFTPLWMRAWGVEVAVIIVISDLCPLLQLLEVSLFDVFCFAASLLCSYCCNNATFIFGGLDSPFIYLFFISILQWNVLH